MENTELFKFRLSKAEIISAAITLPITVLLSAGLIWLSFYSDHYMEQINNGILIKFYIENLKNAGVSLLFFGFGYVFLRKNAKVVILIPLGFYILIIMSQPYSIQSMLKQDMNYEGFSSRNSETPKNLPLLRTSNLVMLPVSINHDGCPGCEEEKRSEMKMLKGQVEMLSGVMKRLKEMPNKKYKEPYWE